MPLDFVNRWPQLSGLVDALAEDQEKIDSVQEVLPSFGSSAPQETNFSPRNSSDYLAIISSRSQRRSRKHEVLVNQAAELLSKAGADISNPFPVDLLMLRPKHIIFEAKVVIDRPIFAIRQAVGQLYEYRYFLGYESNQLCILLNDDPGAELVKYVEEELSLLICWVVDGSLKVGEKTRRVLRTIL